MYFSEILAIHLHPVLSLKDKFRKLKQVLQRLCVELTQAETLQFSTLFARLVFLSNKFGYDKKKQWQLQHFRKLAQAVAAEKLVPTEAEYWAALKIVAETVAFFTQTDIPDELLKLLPHNEKLLPYSKQTFIFVGEVVEKIKVEVLENQQENKILICKTEGNETEENLTVLYGIVGFNDMFNEGLDKVWVGSQLNLLEVRQDKNGALIPKFFVLEPDYLVDASAIAECNQQQNYYVELHLLRKFVQSPKTIAMLVGNLANFFLDEILNQVPENPVEFDTVFQKTFQLYPFDYTLQKDLIDNQQFKLFKSKVKKHFHTIQQVLNGKKLFENDKINVDNCYLEPAFFSEKYGLQGRLDFLHRSEVNSEKLDIVELKSASKVPENSGLWENHLSQTTLYYLLMQSVFGEAAKEIRPAILYSNADQNQLRFAPATRSKEQSLLNLRNRMIAVEYALATFSSLALIEKMLLRTKNLLQVPHLPKYITEEVQNFITNIENANQLERKYFCAFVNFTAKEQLLAKIGDIEYDASNSHAGLWIADFQDKKENFAMLYDLEIIENKANSTKPYIIFSRTNAENDFVNFREGDMIVLYPWVSATSNVLQNQIFKGSIAHIDKQTVSIKIRYQQKNKAYFEQHKTWALEADLLDSGYNVQQKALFSFLACKNQRKKNLLLGIEKPISTELELYTDNKNAGSLNYEQIKILNKALAAKDYFLLVGPPGTGKTSIILRNLVHELNQNPATNLLLLAYTNRAVDEICEAIHELDFLRIGHESSTTEKVREKLLDRKIEQLKTRQQVRDLMEKTRIFVATVAGIANKPDIFALKKFDVAIIDEASQILEPQIIGILPEVEKFIMIGDHKQLPAIVLQNKIKSQLQDADLQAIGLTNRSNSFFERIFNICQQNNWHWAYDTLTHQGRMHVELADFPNRYFYESVLKPARTAQTTAFTLYGEIASQATTTNQTQSKAIQAALLQKRLFFIPTLRVESDKSDKINTQEAELAASLVLQIIENYAKGGKEFLPDKTVGIITPYRNQIAHIRNHLQAKGIADFEKITIDTVERYQGSQRDIIIISFCINSLYQMKNLVSMTDDGVVDRKLNVALTRAREQMIFLGNPALLKSNPIYQALVEYCEQKKLMIVEIA